MADAVTHTFIVSDETILNAYGFRVMTNGIDLAHFKKNPIVIWFHKRPAKWDSKNVDEVLPIGKAVKLWKEDGKLMADIIFDQEDEFAVKIEKKLIGGFLNMCSPGLEPITLSDNPKYLLSGQTRMSLVESRLEEISIVDRGGNDNALRLYKEGKRIELNAGGDNEIVPKITNQNTKMELKVQLAGLLGLGADAADSSFVEAVRNLAAEKGYKTKFETLSREVEEAQHAEIIALVDANVDKKFTADKKETYVALGKTSGMAVLRNVLDNMSDISGRPADITGRTSAPASNDGAVKTFSELAAKGTDFIELYKKDNPQHYAELFKAEYGISI